MRINLLILLGLAACVDQDTSSDPVSGSKLAALYCGTSQCSKDVIHTLEVTSTFTRLSASYVIGSVQLERFVIESEAVDPNVEPICGPEASRGNLACDDNALVELIPKRGCGLFQHSLDDGRIVLVGACDLAR